MGQTPPKREVFVPNYQEKKKGKREKSGMNQRLEIPSSNGILRGLGMRTLLTYFLRFF